MKKSKEFEEQKEEARTMGLLINKLTKEKHNKKTTFVIITGCAGSGKTSLGKRLSRELNNLLN